MNRLLNIPKHIAIIMDGNGRWAERRGHPRVFGHTRGARRVDPIVQEAVRLGVKAITFYAFSTENWNRPDQERQVLWKLLKKYMIKNLGTLEQKNIQLRVIGEIDRLSPDIQQTLKEAVQRLSKNTGLQLTFAFSYGARRELVYAAQAFAQACLLGQMSPGDLTEEKMEQYLWTAGLGSLSEVDLFIRTSGELRISNFLLWQSAYAEFFFTEVCWPDFSPKHLYAAIEDYSGRERRFGGLSKACLQS